MDTYNIKEPTLDDKTYSYFTMLGQHDYLDSDKNPRLNENNNNTLAYSVLQNSKQEQYYIKIGAHGKVYNPIGMFSEGSANKFISKVGKKAWEFKRVSPSVFNFYVRFLRTKNIAWLRNAEREME